MIGDNFLQTENQNKKTYLLVFIIAGIVIIGISIAWFSRSQETGQETTFQEGEAGLGSDLLKRSQESAGDIPNANPVTNPLKDAYKNPFE